MRKILYSATPFNVGDTLIKGRMILEVYLFSFLTLRSKPLEEGVETRYQAVLSRIIIHI